MGRLSKQTTVRLNAATQRRDLRCRIAGRHNRAARSSDTLFRDSGDVDSAKPPAEIGVDVDLARRLLESQHPHVPAADVRLVDEGWDNYLFRVGPDLAMRLPRREAAVPLLVNEQRWLPELADGLGISVPVPVARGAPSDLFPCPWSLVPWIEGEPLGTRSLSSADARRMASVLRLLHRPAPPEAPVNPFRGVPLGERREAVEERLRRLGLTALGSSWRGALTAPRAERAVWIHGDLHARNVLVQDGELTGIIDWGDLAGGDPATDLACAWTLCDARSRRAFRETYRPTGPEWARAKGWATHFGSALLDSGERRHSAIGQVVVDRLGGA